MADEKPDPGKRKWTDVSRTEWMTELKDGLPLPANLDGVVAYGCLQRIALALERIATSLERSPEAPPPPPPQARPKADDRLDWADLENGPEALRVRRLTQGHFRKETRKSQLRWRAVRRAADVVARRLIGVPGDPLGQKGTAAEVASARARLLAFDPARYPWEEVQAELPPVSATRFAEVLDARRTVPPPPATPMPALP